MKLLVGFDGSNSGKEAVNLAEKHAKAFGAQVIVIASMEKGTDNEEIGKVNQHLIWAKKNIEEAKVTC